MWTVILDNSNSAMFQQIVIDPTKTVKDVQVEVQPGECVGLFYNRPARILSWIKNGKPLGVPYPLENFDPV